MSEISTASSDDALVAQLRAWADDLADQVPPVAAPTAERGGHGRPRRAVGLAAAVLVVLAVAGVAVVATGGDDTDEGDVRIDTTTTPVPTVSDVPLLDTTWWVVGIEVDGEERRIPSDFSAYVVVVRNSSCTGYECPTTVQVSGYDGCNPFGGTAELDDDRIVGRGTAGSVAGCLHPVGELAPLVVGLFQGESRATVDGDVLVLEREGVAVTLAPGDDAYPPLPDGAVVLDHAGGPGHRVTWRETDLDLGPGIELELVDEGGTEDVVVEMPYGAAEWWMVADAATRTGAPVVVGLVDARATMVAFEPDGERVDIPTIALEGVDEVRAFVAAVPDLPTRWSLRATGADGDLVSSYVHRG